MSTSGLNKCRKCGGDPRFKIKDHQYGHGVTGFKAWVECQCGMRTIYVYNFGLENYTIKMKLLELWN